MDHALALTQLKLTLLALDTFVLNLDMPWDGDLFDRRSTYPSALSQRTVICLQMQKQ